MTKRIRVSDPLNWGFSLANVIELMVPCLEAVPTKSLLEIGAYEGDLTEVLLDWASTSGASVATVDPLPPDRLRALADKHPELDMIEKTGEQTIVDLESLPDTIIIDGDHNYYTLTNELNLIGERSPAGQMPLLMFHDVGWPHTRRDTYYAPERIPEEHRQPLAHNKGLTPDNPGVSDNGLPYVWAAAQEGGPRNGVLTAIEDFAEARGNTRLVVVPAFFGFGLLYDKDTPFAEKLDALLDPWDDNPILHRLENNRVDHLVANHDVRQQLQELGEKNARQEQLLRDMLESSAFGVAEKISRIRQKGDPIFSKEKIRAALDD